MKRWVIFLSLMLCGFNLHALSTRALIEQKIAVIEGKGQKMHNFASSSSDASKNSFFNTHQVVFFFASTCPYCHKQAPILKQWADKYGVLIDARSFDDKGLPEFENQKPVTSALVEAAFRNQEITYPALFIMNQKTKSLYPAAIGALTEDELEFRMKNLVKKITQYEQGHTS